MTRGPIIVCQLTRAEPPLYLRWIGQSILEGNKLRENLAKSIVEHVVLVVDVLGLWRYLSKFGYETGTGSFNFRFQLAAPKSIPEPAVLQLEVYLDEHWPDVEAEPNFCERQKRAKQVRNISIGPGSNWTEWSQGTLSQNIRPHIWYFVLSDCQQSLANFTHRLKFEFHAQQPNGSEFSVEMRWMLLANVLFLASFIVFLHWFTKRTLAFGKSAGYVHPVIWTLAAGMITQFIAQTMHTIHLLAYKYDGDGLKACEVLSEILFMLAQVIQTSLLILIALGYTLLQSKIGELDLMIPMCFMIGVIHIMLVGFGKIKDDASYKYHENEGVIGWILLSLRLGLYGWFLWAVQSSAREGGFKIANFLRQFRIAGSLYFLAFPAIFLVTQLFAQYLQHSVMTIGQMVMQTGFNLWLSSLFLTRGEYFKAHTLRRGNALVLLQAVMCVCVLFSRLLSTWMGCEMLWVPSLRMWLKTMLGDRARACLRFNSAV
ncbi:gpr180 [Symbiodinium pilosum]|uniref:Gpr180 protein n=1 Tax=Symbiodinium pilosum TaxID=2952 RepID=A0A812WF66_SYMPI|nr:gpr180 [Symbiodinium pilosum]